MHLEHGFNWLSLIPGLDKLPNHVVMAGFVAVVLIGFGAVAGRIVSVGMKKPEGMLVPPGRWTFQNFFEVIAENLYQLAESFLGKEGADKYFGMIGSLFLFVFVSNLCGLIPGLLPPTDNMNTTLALGVFVFLHYHIEGLRSNGLAYLKHFWGPVLLLGPLMFVIEIASHIFRPLSLALRLRGNIMGDHIVLGVFSDLVPVFIPVIFYGLGLFVSFLQAAVFCLMTMVYLSMATAHDH